MDAKTSSTRRKPSSLKNFSYSTAGKYFVTVCCWKRKMIFGEILAGKMDTNVIGDMVAEYWREIPGKFPNVRIDDFVVMPNHFHGIVEIGEEGGRLGPPLPEIIQWWKTLTSNKYFRLLKGQSFKHGKLWQRNYYERVIRNDAEYLALAEYIQTNPLRWELDKYHV